MRSVAVLLFYLTHSFSGSRQFIKQYWLPRCDMPCRNIQWTCEHIIPKSLIVEHNDLHNLILLPYPLNNARSNYPYTNGFDYRHLPPSFFKTVTPCPNPYCDCEIKGKLLVNRLFLPPDKFKGMIGRSVLYMKDKYPHHKQLIHNKVLDLAVAQVWNHAFPPTQKEMDWNSLVSSFQGDSNPYVCLSDKSHK